MFELKKAKKSDRFLLADLSSSTFTSTYLPTNKQSDIDYFIQQCCQPLQIASEIEDPLLDYLLFFEGVSLTGYCKLRYHEAEQKIEIARFYLTESFIGKGVAKFFMEHLIEYAKKLNFSVLELSVWKENLRAIRFYEKSGFKITGETTFDWGTGKIDNDWTMSNQLDNEKIR